MGKRMFLEVENKRTPIIIYNNYASNLRQNIEDVILKLGGTELGSVKTKFYEEFFYTTQNGSWEIYLDIAVRPAKYKIKYGNEYCDNVSAYVTLINFNRHKFCKYVFDELSKIGELNGDIRSDNRRH